ncbi:MAG: hypothetical protein Q8R04_06970 [Nanoarchaeota archaeon]|nr:hypothetical protein [Nanoarchaeota archaeon]
MEKRGTIGTLGEIIIMVIVLVVALNFVIPHLTQSTNPFSSLFGIGRAEAGNVKEQSKSPSSAEQAFSSFVSFYESCKKYSADNCWCEQFDMTTIPQGYSIKLESLNGEKTRLELYSDKPTPEKARVIDNDNLCLYSYDKPTKTFSNINSRNIVLDSGNYPYKINNKIYLFRLDGKNTCLVSGTFETKEFDEITKLQKKCSLKAISTKTSRTGMLDFGDYTGDYSGSFPQSKDAETSRIIEDLNTFLLNNVGEVTRITRQLSSAQSRLERRQNMFNEAYRNFDKNKDTLLNDDAYFISLRGLFLQSKYSQIKKDYLKIHYLQGSEQSRILADKIKTRLQELNGKLIFNDKEVGVAEAPAGYRFDFEIIVEENSKGNIGPVFLACADDYSNFAACKENTLIPAVFIDIIEISNENYMFDGHTTTIARKVYEGIKDYLG